MSHDNHDSHSHHITPLSTYFKVFGLLLLGMFLTVAWARFALTLPQSPLLTFTNNIIAMTIAIAKAALVIAFFMGVKYSTKLVRFYALLGFAWVGWIGLTFCDYASRHWEPVPGWDTNPRVSFPTQANLPKPDVKANVPRQLQQEPPKQP